MVELTADSAEAVWKTVAYVEAGVIVAVVGGMVKLAKIAWDERMGRIEDRNHSIAQLQVTAQAAKRRKEESP